MSTTNNLTDFLTNMADSIRAAKGTNSLINPQDFADNVRGLSLGYNVTFNDGESDYTIVSVPPGGTISEPPAPSGTGTFVGWYTAAEGGELVSFPYTPSAHVTLYAHFSLQTIIGATGFDFNQAGTLTWTDDLVGKTGYSTSVVGNDVTVTSDLDSVFPYNQISEFTDAEGNVFIKIPKLWMKWVYTGSDIDGVKISNIQADQDYFIPDCFLDPTDSTLSTYLDYFAIGKYEASGDSSKIYSKTGQTTFTNVSRETARTAARAYGTSSNAYNGYQLYDFSMWVVYNLLCSIYYKNINMRNIFQTGTSKQPTGTVDGVSALNGWNTSNQSVKMLGVEHPYGNVDVWLDGVWIRNASSSTAKVMAFRDPKKYHDGWLNSVEVGTCSTGSSSSYLSSLRPGTGDTTKTYVYKNGSSSTSGYYGSPMYFDASHDCAIATSGYYGESTKAGIWYFYSLSYGDTGTWLGCRLAYRPVG